MKKITGILLLVILSKSYTVHAQKHTLNNDTLPFKTLKEVIVNTASEDTIRYLPNVKGTYIFAGKKTNLIQLNDMRANLAQNNIRQAFAKIPGLTMWDMDGAGTQLNIGSRGTDSHRSIEMNMRQNGYVTNSDIFGYPENHYTVPLEAVQEVQLVRGSAALQFGSQFGGMMNFVIKDGDSTKPVAIESEQTAGSNNFFNSFNAVGGTVGKINYYTYYDNRHGDGWRPNAAFNYHAYYANINYRFSTKGSIALQFSRMDYVQQIAGGLTDAQFQQNSRQSFRARNYFNPEINIPALIFNYALSRNTQLNITSHVLFGQRNSVQFINTANIKDTVNTAIGSYNPRQVDRDYYDAFTTEARILHRYTVGKTHAVLSTGIRYSTELTKRKQKGVGTTGSNFDLSLVKPYGIDLRFTTHNYAVFAENIFQFTRHFSFTPGVRYEIINSNLSGLINNATTPVNYKGNRYFPLFGAGLQYQVNRSTQLYGNISQAYRPYLYSTITPADRVDIIDPNLKDSKGYDIDLGYRGSYKNIVAFDVNAFYLFYGNRAGLLAEKDANNNPYLLTTNIGDAVSKGVEAYMEVSLAALLHSNRQYNDIRIFNSLSYTHARYINGQINKSGTNVSLKGNYVESVPDWMNKTGLQVQVKNFSTTLQFSYTGKSYNDALNTVSSTNGVTGEIPSYHLWDWAASFSLNKMLRFSAGINNLSNESYFSRRITFYPGPGILPADGRTFYISFGIKI